MLRRTAAAYGADAELDAPLAGGEGGDKDVDFAAPAPRLRAFVVATATLHLGGAAAVIAVNKDQLVPLTRSYLVWPPSGSGLPFGYGSNCTSKISMQALITAFFMLSFAAQIWPALWGNWAPYLLRLRAQAVQPYRWFEYAFSASCLFVLGTLLQGATDFYFVTQTFAAMWTVMLMGLLQELVAYYLTELERLGGPKRFGNATAKDEILAFLQFVAPHLVGWVLYLFLWIGSLDRFRLAIAHAPQRPPKWVYGFFVFNFLVFSSFGFVQLAEMLLLYRTPATDAGRATRARVAVRAEVAYVTLSLLAKSVSAYFLLGGLLANSGAGSYTGTC